MKKKYLKILIIFLILFPVCVYAKDPCKQILGNNTLKMVKDAYNIVRFATPIVLLSLSTFDFIKAISSQNADELQKTIKRFGKRLMIALVILILPTIIFFILDDVLGMNICKI